MKTYQQFNESLKDWYNRGRNVRIPNEDKASFKTLRQDDRAQQGKFIKPESKGKHPSRLTDDDFEGGALPRNMSQLKDFMQGKGGATWSFTRGMKTGPTALTRQTIERPLKKIGKLAKMLKQ